MRTELPRKWAVKAYSKKEAEVIFPYNNKSKRCFWDISNSVHYNFYANYENGKYLESSKYLLKDHEEITFEEFKTLVLGEKQQPTEPQYEVY